MTQTGDSGKKTGKSGHRDKRLAAALRENLRRRKAQERARDAAQGPPTGPKPARTQHEDESR